MKRGVLVILVIGIAVLLAGCPRVGGEPREGWRVGSQGIQMVIPPNLPPPRIYDDQPLELIVDMENLGAHDVGGPGDRIYLHGFDPNLITGIPLTGELMPLMEGKTQFGPGGIGTISFQGVVRSLSFRNVDRLVQPLFVTSCYGYKTIASDTVCIDPDPFGRASEVKVCIPRSVSMGGTQAGPVSVSPVNVEASPGRTRFEITVNNVGRGDIFRPGGQYLQKCSPYSAAKLDFPDLDRVLVEEVSVGGTNILSSCRPLDSGYLRLTNGRGRMFCEFNNIRGSSAFTTSMTVILGYGYRDTVPREVTILRVT